VNWEDSIQQSLFIQISLLCQILKVESDIVDVTIEMLLVLHELQVS
jgi:hypothetical protein